MITNKEEKKLGLNGLGIDLSKLVEEEKLGTLSDKDLLEQLARVRKAHSDLHNKALFLVIRLTEGYSFEEDGEQDIANIYHSAVERLGLISLGLIREIGRRRGVNKEVADLVIDDVYGITRP
ncbi:MAG: hypothetical protein HYS32_04120 [Candidatus Woesearchaeota archaeon]|nr:MAG: hypothetical protein HYS32_04120 [Candidatus Woesearchaeota archaeon]